MPSSRPVLSLDVSERPLGSGARREIRLHTDARAEPVTIFHEIYGNAGEIVSLDGFVQAVIFLVMQLGLPLRVRGDMTERALYHLEDFQRAWAKWRPERYHVVDIIPDKIIEPVPTRMSRTIAAYSGGVDSNFTLVRNKTRASRGGLDIRSVLMVQGFDVRLFDNDGMSRLIKRCQPIFDDLDVDVQLIRTNSKELGMQSWEDSHAAELSACLHQFSSVYTTGLIGGGSPYDYLEIPWGSNPITDHLLSTGFMSVLHDAAGFSRVEKVEYLTKFPLVVERLKVCWEGRSPDSNCGICEKCIRTRLCFVAAGETYPKCFDQPFDRALIKKWRASQEAQLSDFRSMVVYAKQHRLRGAWVRMAEHRLWLRMARLHLIRALDAAGLKGPVRKTVHSVQGLLSFIYR